MDGYMTLHLILSLSLISLARGVSVNIYLVNFDEKVIEGTSRQLECRGDGLGSNPVLTHWYKDGQPLSPRQSKYSGLDSSFLTITNLQVSDEGDYTCAVISGPDRHESTRPYKLSVSYGYDTKVTNKNPDQLPIKDFRVVLKCAITREGKPPGDTTEWATWYHNGKKLALTEDVNGKYVINDRTRGLEIKVNNLAKEDTGNYTCNIENNVNDGVKTPEQVRVQYGPGKPEVHPLTNRVFQAGGNFSLTCHLDDLGYPPANTYTWLNENGDILSTEEGPHYILSWTKLQSETIKCQASSKLTFSEDSDWATITSDAGPVVESNSSKASLQNDFEIFTLTCTISGTMPDDITWYKDAKIIQSGEVYTISSQSIPGDFKFNQKSAIETSLVIDVGKLADKSCFNIEKYSGKYHCKGKAMLGGKEVAATKTQVINIHAHPKWDEDVDHEVITAIGSKNMEIPCAVCGLDPDSPVTWTFEGEKKLPDGVDNKGNKLHIKTVKDKHIGQYKCTVKDMLSVMTKKGDAESTFPIKLRTGAGVPGENKGGGAAVAISVVIVIIVLFILAGLIFFLYRRHKKKQKEEEDNRDKQKQPLPDLPSAATVELEVKRKNGDAKEPVDPPYSTIDEEKPAHQSEKEPLLLEKPGPPTKLEVSERTQTSCVLSWQPPEGNARVTGYKILWHEGLYGEVQPIDDITTELSRTLDHLTTKTHYFAVIALNGDMESEPSKEIQSTYVYSTPPPKPPLVKEPAIDKEPTPPPDLDTSTAPLLQTKPEPDESTTPTLLVMGGINCDWTQLHQRSRDSQGKVYNYVDTVNLAEETVDKNGTPDLPLGRFKSCAVTHGDFIYVIGGASGLSGNRPKATASLYRYCISKKQWEILRSMSINRIDAAAFSIAGFIFVLGGWNPSRKQLDDVECYDINADQWIPKKNLPNRLDMLASCVMDDVAYVSGGRLLDESVFGGIWGYEIRNNSWFNTGVALQMPRWDHAMTAHNEKIFIFGGGDGKHILNYVEMYDVPNKQVTVISPMPHKRKGTMALNHGGNIYLVGGWGRSRTSPDKSQATDTVLVFDVSSRKWREMDMPLSRKVAWASCVVALI